MQIKKYLFPNLNINQMNTNFKIEIATTNNDTMIMKQLEIAAENIDQELFQIDRNFSLFRYDSLLSQFQRGDDTPLKTSEDFKVIHDSAVLAEQMTAGLYTPYFAGKYDPTELVKSWALEQVFNDFLVPLLENSEIDGIWLSNDNQIKVATKPGTDFKWSIDIRDSNKRDEIVTTYYLDEGVISLQENNAESSLHNNQSGMRQAIIVGHNLIETKVWALVATSAKAEKFAPFIEPYHLSGLLIDRQNNVWNFNNGVITNSKETLS